MANKSDSTAHFGETIPVHQWTNGTGRVQILKCVKSDGTSHDGFKWPESGPVRPDYCKPDDRCETGGLFGWAHTIGFGDGKDPDFGGKWIVFSAPPEQVFEVGGTGKVKVAAKTPAEVDAIVEFYGDWDKALRFIEPALKAWCDHEAKGAASATGYSSAASATGYRSAASATGYSSAASATGDSSAASATGYRSAASATGDSSAASATGYRSAASATGDNTIAAITGTYNTIEVGPHALGASTAVEFYWRVRSGAVVACRWTTDEKTWHHALLVADELGLKDGQLVTVKEGTFQADV